MSNDPENRRRSVRLRGFDYAYRGFYFITICTHDKKPTLGKIVNYQTRLSDIGKIVEGCWLAIPQHFPNVYLDEWIIMPNHIHGIIVINSSRELESANEGMACRAPTTVAQSYQAEEFGKPVAGSLATIVRSFKSAATKSVREQCGVELLTLWQRNYFEHVIRNEESMNKIRNYIWENPIHWHRDEYYAG
jgi:putative transposase